jgi:hypothetical protein
MGTCDKYLWCQMGYSDLEKKLPFQDSDLWVATPMCFPMDQLMSTHEFPWLVPSLTNNLQRLKDNLAKKMWKSPKEQ